MEQIIKLSDQLKRIEVFTHDQRIILAAGSGLTISSIALLYYSAYPILILPLAIAVNYWVLSRILISRKRAHILASLIRPSMWLLFLYGYIYTIHVIFLIPIGWFILLCVLVGVGYMGLLLQEVRNKPNVIFVNILHIVLLTLGLSLASLMLAYWHWPVVLVMLGVWLSMFFLSLAWLLSFTNKPYVIASVWSLIVLEIFWITTLWINLYHIPQTNLLLSQSSLIVAALAYGFGGLYYHFKENTLRRSLLFEYISVTAVVFIALLLLSKWAVAL